MNKATENATARERILARLKASGTHETVVPDVPMPAALSLNRGEKIERLSNLMTAIRSEVFVVESGAWQDKLKDLARERGWKKMLYGPQGPLGKEIETAWSSDVDGLPELVAYTQPVEAFKDDLFHAIDVGITSTRGGIAESGAVVLWPTPAEPRLMSLVPPVHVVVLDADAIYSSMNEMMAAEKWVDGMPTNALLISGPSKTADIEFTLVFGVHGPKELVVIIKK
jgi:L-lactate dehydrogenase complex protein LldG